ncbi:MAG: cell envelope biogenesis protein OmpA [Saprospiraceae bacterium]|nr:MAG: cell envelope biogenesis protein OmpA [Saprospiraceae bacterium]
MGIASQILKYITILCLLFPLGASAQKITTEKDLSKKEKKWYEEALSYNRSENFPDAISALDKVIEAAPDFLDARILQASIKGQMGDLAASEQGFEAILHQAPDYNNRILYELALTEMQQLKYDESVLHFKQYLAADTKSDRRRQKAEIYLVNARFAAEAVKNPVPFDPVNLGDSINTTDQEYLPSFTADGEYLIFTARVNRQEDFFYSQKIAGQWTMRKSLDAINTPQNEGAQSISADGRLLIFTFCGRTGPGSTSCDLFYSENQNGTWVSPKPLQGPINTAGWEGQPSLSADGQTLYFASDRPGGKGGRDIWQSKRLSDGSWSQPINLGDKINTPANDECPFIHPDGETLYFCSAGHPGMGGLDLYLVRRTPGGDWQTPINLGYPINTPATEGTLTVSLDGKTAYFARDKNGLNDPQGQQSRLVDNDIYSFPLYPEARPQLVTYVKAKVVNAQGRRGMQADITFIDLTHDQTFLSATTDNKGNFLVSLPAGRDYALNVNRTGYLFHSEHFALSEANTADNPYILEIILQPIPTDDGQEGQEVISDPIVLQNLFFATGSAELKPASTTELQRLKKLLTENPKLRIRINGHTDNVGSEADNLRLSEERAKAVYNWLKNQDIAPDRLSYKGFGESLPITDNDTPEGRQRNRRTDFVVIGKGI